MKNISKLYIRDVIKVLDDFKKKLKNNSKISYELDDKLYNKYLKLEKLINVEFKGLK